MDDIFTRFFEHLAGRIEGPFALRILLQPTMASLLAIRDGVRDAKAGQPPYFWALLTDSANCRERLCHAWTSVAKVFLMAIALDLVYQFIVFHWIYPLETLVVAVLLALLPYIFLRGPINRLMRLWNQRPRRV